MPSQRLSIKNRRVGPGDGVRTVTLPMQATDTDLLVSITVDDPTVDPPTPAAFALTVDALVGADYVPIHTFVFAMSSEMTALVPVRGRTLQLRYRSDADHTIDVSAVVP